MFSLKSSETIGIALIHFLWHVLRWKEASHHIFLVEKIIWHHRLRDCLYNRQRNSDLIPCAVMLVATTHTNPTTPRQLSFNDIQWTLMWSLNNNTSGQCVRGSIFMLNDAESRPWIGRYRSSSEYQRIISYLFLIQIKT